MRAKNDRRMADILEFIRAFTEENGAAPTFGEICREMGIAKSTVSKYVNRLIECGELDKLGRYRTVPKDAPRGGKRLPILGAVACGKPMLAVEDIDGYMTVDGGMLGEGEFFALVAEGDSMVEVGIASGDIVYIRRQQSADEGDIVVAIVEDETTGESRATLKRLFRDPDNRSFILHPENRAMSDIVVQELRIVGIAVRVLKNLRK